MKSEKDLPVPDKKEIVIKDACILFDLVDLELLAEFFLLELIALTTPEVVGEITNEEQWAQISLCINDGRLIVDNDAEYDAILSISEQYPALSAADSSVLELALRKDAAICSSDGPLRKVATKQDVIVRGVLWIIEQLYLVRIITKETAIEKLKTYSEVNSRSPKSEIEKLIMKIKDHYDENL